MFSHEHFLLIGRMLSLNLPLSLFLGRTLRMNGWKTSNCPGTRVGTYILVSD